jgi:hypothetical protein
LGYCVRYRTGRIPSAAGGRNQKPRRKSDVSFRQGAVGGGTAVLIGLSSAAIAQTKKSTPATTIGEGEAIMVNGANVHKSNSPVTAAQHTAAVSKGAKEISGGTVIYKQGGKLYMLQDNANDAELPGSVRRRLLVD